MTYSNKDCEIVALNGKLEGLKHHLNSLLNVNANPRYKIDLSEEITRVNKEIQETQTKLDELNNVL
jgi:peptidoglycan hydrolase CwlO-like protein